MREFVSVRCQAGDTLTYTPHTPAAPPTPDPRDAEIARLRSLLEAVQYTANGRSTDERDNYNRLVDIDQLIHEALKSNEPGA